MPALGSHTVTGLKLPMVGTVGMANRTGRARTPEHLPEEKGEHPGTARVHQIESSENADNEQPKALVLLL